MKCFYCGEPAASVICEKHEGLLPPTLREQLLAAADEYWGLRLASGAWIALVERDDMPSEEALSALKNLVG